MHFAVSRHVAAVYVVVAAAVVIVIASSAAMSQPQPPLWLHQWQGVSWREGKQAGWEGGIATPCSMVAWDHVGSVDSNEHDERS